MRASASSRSSSATSAASVGPPPRYGQPAGAPLDARGAAARRPGRGHLRPSTTCPTTASSTSTATSCPATSCRCSGSRAGTGRASAVDVAIAVCEDLWQDGGPVTVTRHAGAGLLVVLNASPYEREQGRHPAASCAQRRAARGGRHARLREHGRRPGRAGLRRRLADRGRGRAGCSPAGRSSRRRWSSRTWTCRRPARCPAGGRDRRRPRRHDDDDPPRQRAGGSHAVHAIPPRWRTPPARPGPGVAAAGSAGGGLRGAGDRGPRLRAQERLPLGHPRPVRRDRLRADAPPSRPTPSAPTSCTWCSCPAGTPPGTRWPTPRTSSSGRACTRATVPIQPMVDAFQSELRADRPGRGEPAGPGARRHPHDAVQRGGPPGADDRQQERDRHRLLHPVRRLGGRLRADQGRAEDAGLGAGAVAQRGGCPARADRRRSRRTRSSSHRAPSSPPASSTPTRCPTTRCWTPCSTTTWSRTWVAAELVAAGHDPALVDRVIAMVDHAEYKRRQYPPGPKITPRNFGRDRRLPITNRWAEPHRS